MIKCKVKGCNNSVIDSINKKVRSKDMKNKNGYCQIHLIDGLVKQYETK